MTRAPRSASWRVANGPAMTCSSATTVTPSSGLGSLVRDIDRDLIYARAGFLYHLAEAGNFGADQRGELIRRHAAGLEAELAQLVAVFRHAQDLHGRGMQARDDFSRRLRRGEHRLPRRDVIARQAGFRHCRDVRRDEGAL